MLRSFFALSISSCISAIHRSARAKVKSTSGVKRGDSGPEDFSLGVNAMSGRSVAGHTRLGNGTASHVQTITYVIGPDTLFLAESEGFEPPRPFGLADFKSAAFNRSANSPVGAFYFFNSDQMHAATRAYARGMFRRLGTTRDRRLIAQGRVSCPLRERDTEVDLCLQCGWAREVSLRAEAPFVRCRPPRKLLLLP